MDQKEAVYEQIMEVTNSTTGADYQQLVQEIVVQNDHGPEPSMACEMQGIEIMLPNDCITVQDQENVVTCNNEGIVCSKQSGNELLQQEDSKHNVVQSNNSEQCEVTYEVNQEDKIEEFLVQNQSDYNQESYEMNHSVTTTESENKENKDQVPETSANESVPEMSCDQSSENHNVLNNNQIVTNEVDSKNDALESSEQSVSGSQNVESTSEPTSTNADELSTNGGEQQLHQDNHCTSEADTVYTAESMYKSEVVDSSMVTNVEFIVETSGAVTVSNSDDVMAMSELNAVGCSMKNHTDEQQANAVPESSKDDIDQTQIKPDTTNNDTYAEADEDDLELHLSTQSQEGHSKVIQDIFNDWQDENGEDDVQQQQDSVEMELQNLLNDGSSSVSTPLTRPVERRQSADKSDERSSNRSSRGSSKESATNHAAKLDLENKVKQSPRPGVKVPGAHLTSQIASTAEVNEVLKERLKEKQKDLQTPKTADIVFVKKITQRLSSQLLAAAPVLPPVQPPTEMLERNKESDSNKSLNASTDNNELLAILEGDSVDPDWSDLKSQSNFDESNKVTSTVLNVETNVTGNKLDPVTERELAIKQLLELPNTSKKGSSSSSKKSVSKKTPKSNRTPSKEDDSTQSSVEDESASTSKKRKSLKDKANVNEVKEVVEIAVEESRSGRKRKLTEKARELTVKKQKTIVKSRKSESDSNSVNSPKPESKQKKTETSTEDTEAEKVSEIKEVKEVKEEKEHVEDIETKVKDTEKNECEADTEDKEMEDKSKESEDKSKGAQTKAKGVENKGKGIIKRSKIGIIKKDAPISKKKLAVKNMIRQKKAAVASKLKSQTDKPSTGTVRTKKSCSEIDKLLQDEGIVNMLYDAEQPDSRRRLVPITKSQKKIMDVDKAERELKLRTKLVRNAVLRLRAAPNTVITPRARRSLTTPVDSTPEKKTSASKTSPSPQNSQTSDFMIPSKIRNAADASRIIRRHSSSSFSSASGASPRVSIDLTSSSDLAEIETLSKKKILLDSVCDKVEKKGKKKSIKTESEVDDSSDTKSPIKKETPKKTRSNNSTTPVNKTQVKGSKKSNKRNSFDFLLDDSKEELQDELAACIASAASNVRKKATAKSNESEKGDIKSSFSNKEINVRQHGHLVQLILTPSSTTSEIRNAITIQIMNEIRETLSILKNDDNCRVVLFTTTGTSFCEGIDLSYLIHPSKDERKNRADTMARTVKEFIKALATFNKPLVAGVQGSAVGLGVTMLPLFDLVIASDKATFSTPYAKLGQIAEGASVLTLSHSIGSAVTNELLLGGRVLTASEALRAGLVTRVSWPDKFQGELLPSLKAMSEQSLQSMEATKTFLRYSLRKKLDAALDSESLLLSLHWCTPECQEAIKSFMNDKDK